MSKKKHRKPIGETGPLRVENSAGSPLVSWEKIKFPEDKATQEMLIASAFLKELNAIEPTPWQIRQLDENDFDFEITNGTETKYLELQEIIIPPAKRGTPYASKDQLIESGKFSKTILSSIGMKAGKYNQPVDLLVYNTHWRFLPTDNVRRLVAHGLAQSAQPFSRVFMFSIIQEGVGILALVYPNPQFIEGFDPRTVKDNRYVNFDPAQAQPIKNEDGSIGVRHMVDPQTWKRFNEPP